MRMMIVMLALLLPFSVVEAKGGRTHVRAHTKKNGTRVPAHNRTSANKSKHDNWSTKGNVNPETGKRGTKDP